VRSTVEDAVDVLDGLTVDLDANKKEATGALLKVRHPAPPRLLYAPFWPCC
jgi:hypothetical protein